MIPKKQYLDQLKLFKNRENQVFISKQSQTIDKMRLDLIQKKRDERIKNKVEEEFVSHYQFRTLCSYDYEVFFFILLVLVEPEFQRF